MIEGFKSVIKMTTIIGTFTKAPKAFIKHHVLICPVLQNDHGNIFINHYFFGKYIVTPTTIFYF
jgi:hypothetical protein